MSGSSRNMSPLHADTIVGSGAPVVAGRTITSERMRPPVVRHCTWRLRMVEQPAPPKPPFARYEVRNVLGRGGFATVYRAWDPLLRREVALKTLLPHLADDADLRRRFLNEARVLAGLRHPNIVTIHDAGETPGHVFFAMELIEARTLTGLLAERGRLDLPETAAILHEVAGALDELHAHGSVHRDTKPSNIMVDHGGRVVLMDFSIARAHGASQTGTAALLGTPTAMAPEKVRGESVGPVADVYALGVLACQLLAGRPPFTGEVARILHGHAYEPPPSPRGARPGLPESVYEALDSVLAKEPRPRPSSAGEFVARLARSLTAPRPSRQRPGSPDDARAASSTRRMGTAATRESVRASGANTAIRPGSTRRTGVLTGGRGRYAVGLAALAVAGVLVMLTVPLPRFGSRSSEVLPPASVTEAEPVVHNLQVFDSVLTRRQDRFAVNDSIAACFALTPGSDPRPLTLIVANRDDARGHSDDPTVVGRSSVASQRAGEDCYTVPIAGPPPPGAYWLSVLDGSRRLDLRGFTVTPNRGDALLEDSFEDPARGALPRTSPAPGRYRLGTEAGEYLIEKVDPGWAGVPFVMLPGTYENAALVFDVRLVGATSDRYITAGCRMASAALDSGYRLSLSVERGTFVLDRWDNGALIPLVTGESTAATMCPRASITWSCTSSESSALPAVVEASSTAGRVSPSRAPNADTTSLPGNGTRALIL